MGIFHGIFHSFLYVYQRVAINPYQSYPAAITKMGDFIRVKKSVLELEDLLKLRFRPFRHKATGAPRYKVRQEKPYEHGNQKTETYWDWVWFMIAKLTHFFLRELGLTKMGM